MTNFSGSQRLAWLSRERVLIGVPALVGLVLAIGLGLGFARPALQRVNALKDRLADLASVEQSLPLLIRNLGEAELSQRQAEEQQALLVDLIAGSERIDTFLALLDREAAAAGVNLLLYEPMTAPASAPETGRRPPPPSPGGQAKADAGEEGKGQSSQDPLVALGYRKSLMLLRAEGAFSALQAFLQRMEQLQLLVESSDLELQSVQPPDQDPSEPDVPAKAMTELGLQLSFYDRQPTESANSPGDAAKPAGDDGKAPAVQAPS